MVKTTSPDISWGKKLGRLNSQIVEAHQKENTALTIEELRMIFAKVSVMHGLKALPDDMTTQLCLTSWEDKYAPIMNKQELNLAFLMNVNGDYSIETNSGYEQRVNHYQCFSVEFFCSVLNQYTKEKDRALVKLRQVQKANETETVAPPDMTEDIFLAIIEDYIEYHKGKFVYYSHDRQFETHKTFNTLAKLELLSAIFSLELSEANIIKLRGYSQGITLADLRAKKATATSKGAILSLANQITRIKTAKMILKEDEDLIQVGVKRLLYLQVIDSYKPVEGQKKSENEFIRHVKENIQLYKQNKLT